MKQPILYLSIFVLALFSCKGTAPIDRGPIPERSKEEIIQSLQDHNLTYDWFAAEGKMKFDTPQEKGTVKGYLRMKRDSAIWVVFKKLSVEAARILIKKDSFFVLYRLQQKFERGATADILSNMNVKSSFEELQDYLIGNIPNIDSSNLEVYQKEKEWIAETKIESYLLRMHVDPYDLTISGYDMFGQKNESLSARYKDFRPWENLTIPYKRDFILDLIDHGYNSAKMDLKKIEIDIPKTLKFSIPSHYEEIQTFR